MASHHWTNEVATQLHCPTGDVAYTTHPDATPSSLLTSTNTSIVQSHSYFGADLVHETAFGFEPIPASVYYTPHEVRGGGTGLWSGAGTCTASPHTPSETLSNAADEYAVWSTLGGNPTQAREEVTLLSAYESMGSFSQASGGVSAGGSIPPVPRLVVASKKTLRASALRRFRRSKYGCQLCHSEFTTKQNCIRHIHAHWGIKLFRCSCGKQFTTKSDMTRHQRKSHQVTSAGRATDFVCA